MSEQVMPFVGGQPDFLSMVNAEVEKVEPTSKVLPTPPYEQPPSLVPPESLPIPTERPKEVQHQEEPQRIMSHLRVVFAPSLWILL